MPTKRQRRKKRRRPRPAGAGAGGSDAGESRAAGAPAEGGAAARGRAATAASRRSGAPQALWGSFPLSELVVLLALILLVAGFFIAGQRGGVMMIVGITLGALAGVELAAREHFSGYRSHNLLLAAVPVLVTFAVLILLTPLTPVLCVAAAVGVSASSAWLLIQAFRRRSGGAAFRIKPG